MPGRVLHLYGVETVEGSSLRPYEGASYRCGAMATAHLVELTLGLDVDCAGMDKN
jgi:hypothetical protein